MIRSHKIRLRPTEEQKKHLFRAFAASRYAWNWGKEILDFEYDLNQVTYRETGKSYKFTAARVRLKKLYRKNQKPEWTYNTGTADNAAFDDLDRAIKRYFDIRKGSIKLTGQSLKEADERRWRKDGKKAGWLKWRNKRDHNSFRMEQTGSLKVDGPYIRYNAKVGYIRMCEEIRFSGKIMNATFSYDGQWFWASVPVKVEKPNFEPKLDVVGVDLGIKYLAITSEGDEIENPKAYYQAQNKLRRLQRKLDRQRRANNPDNFNEDGTIKKGRLIWSKSNQLKHTETKIKRVHNRIKNIRHNAQHQLTSKLAQNYGLIVLEDLNVSGMLKNHKLAKAIADAGFYEIKRQFEYKSDFYNNAIGIVDRWFPSSKLCSNCKEKKLDLSLSDREWICSHCGQHNDRDLNAAINLKNEGIRLFINPHCNRP